MPNEKVKKQMFVDALMERHRARATHGSQCEGCFFISEIERLREDCGEAYQVVGTLADEAGVFNTREVERAMDNLVAAAQGEPRPHTDVLPFMPRRPWFGTRIRQAIKAFTYGSRGKRLA